MFPKLYHTHNSLSPDDLDFWYQLAESHQGPILELGCGTGRVLSHLAQTIGPVYGLDHDFAMLKFLTEITPAPLLSNISIFQGDFTKFHLGMRFDLIFLACNTYSTLANRQRVEMLERVYFHLRPNGTFATSMPNPVALKRLSRQSDLEVEEVFPHPTDGEPVQVSSAWMRSGSQLTITWIYDHLQPDGNVDRLQYDVIQHIIPMETILDEFQSAGLKVIRIFGEYDGSPLTNESDHLILVSTRSGNSLF